jgi:hypothetical protein
MGESINKSHHEPWNKDKQVGQKAPFKLKSYLGRSDATANRTPNQGTSPQISRYATVWSDWVDFERLKVLRNGFRTLRLSVLIGMVGLHMATPTPTWVAGRFGVIARARHCMEFIQIAIAPLHGQRWRHWASSMPDTGERVACCVSPPLQV